MLDILIEGDARRLYMAKLDAGVWQLIIAYKMLGADAPNTQFRT